MRKLIIGLSFVLVILIIVLVVLIQKKLVIAPSFSTPSPTASIAPSRMPKTTVYPESLLPTPESLAPSEPYEYEKLPSDQKEFGALIVSLPINTNDYMVYFNFADSTFQVTIFTDKGMEDYRKLRQKYPNLKDSLFILVDRRVELFKL